MRKTIKKAVAESVNDLIEGGFSTSFSDRELKELGIKIKDVQIESEKIQRIRKKTHFSQTVFARLLNVSPSSVRQWEQGKRKPTGSTKVLLEILDKTPTILNYRITQKGSK
jgi:putative transcriptional regulator